MITKRKYGLMLFFMLMIFIQAGHAQFLKKLTQKVQKKVEDVVLDKTSDKAADKTSKSMDKLFDFNFKNGTSTGKKVDIKDLPATYNFSYQYTLKMTTSNGDMDIDYFLEPDVSYMGVRMNAGVPFFMITDDGTNATYMFMESGGNKIVTATALNMDEEIEAIENLEVPTLNDFTITNLPNKTYLGYNCIGKQFENEQYVFTSYFTMDAPVSFDQVFKSEMERYPGPIKEQFQAYEGALLMYMEMKDKVNKGKKNTSGSMECTSIKSVDFKFNTSGYQKL